ncbi:uncharacterized protein N7483_002432 [Penicillium malachiteum]|uniref:uncharacterized protein n=1 Tax=Penicillium malachiteum TaxID=1324776 RepID=UPI00254724C6|nr:uncharacterized protein N7483_002432 [Penicillium malachiteum]KAJ5737307.1 hypothetical protein N7483_002432 [Penicillium malachiteum]
MWAYILLLVLTSMSLAFPTDFAVKRRTFGLSASNLGSFLDVAGEAFDLVDTALGSSAHASMDIPAGLSPQGAAALGGSALGCSASTIDVGAREELRSWLASQTGITGSLKPLLQSWCESEGSTTLDTDVVAALSVHIPTCAHIAAKGSLYITVDGIFPAGDLQEASVLGTSDQESLSAFLSAYDSLGADIHAGLSVCAAGGAAISLDAHFKASLLAWTQASNCPLSANLQRSVLAWCQGSRGGHLTTISSSTDSTLITFSVGASVGAFVEEGGPLSAHAQAALKNFLDTRLATDIDASVLAGLTACAAGSYATSIDVDIRTAVAAWLSSSRCSLGVELKAIVFLWLSQATSAEMPLSHLSGPAADLAGLLTEDTVGSLSTILRAVLGLVHAGGSLSLLS